MHYKRKKKVENYCKTCRALDTKLRKEEKKLN